VPNRYQLNTLTKSTESESTALYYDEKYKDYLFMDPSSGMSYALGLTHKCPTYCDPTKNRFCYFHIQKRIMEKISHEERCTVSSSNIDSYGHYLFPFPWKFTTKYVSTPNVGTCFWFKIVGSCIGYQVFT